MCSVETSSVCICIHRIIMWKTFSNCKYTHIASTFTPICTLFSFLFVSPFRFFFILETEKKLLTSSLPSVWRKKLFILRYEYSDKFFYERRYCSAYVLLFSFYLFRLLSCILKNDEKKTKANPPTQRCRHAFSIGNPSWVVICRWSIVKSSSVRRIKKKSEKKEEKTERKEMSE